MSKFEAPPVSHQESTRFKGKSSDRFYQKLTNATNADKVQEQRIRVIVEGLKTEGKSPEEQQDLETELNEIITEIYGGDFKTAKADLALIGRTNIEIPSAPKTAVEVPTTAAEVPTLVDQKEEEKKGEQFIKPTNVLQSIINKFIEAGISEKDAMQHEIYKSTLRKFEKTENWQNKKFKLSDGMAFIEDINIEIKKFNDSRKTDQVRKEIASM